MGTRRKTKKTKKPKLSLAEKFRAKFKLYECMDSPDGIELVRRDSCRVGETSPSAQGDANATGSCSDVHLTPPLDESEAIGDPSDGTQSPGEVNPTPFAQKDGVHFCFDDEEESSVDFIIDSRQEVNPFTSGSGKGKLHCGEDTRPRSHPVSVHQQQRIEQLLQEFGITNFGKHSPYNLKKINVLGSGASGCVHKVQLLSNIANLPSFFARKMVVMEKGSEFKAKVIRSEIELLSTCRHRHIVGLHGAYFENSCLFLLLDYMDCGSLKDVLEIYGPIPERILAKLAVQLLSALIYLHDEKHILHRDIKPENILLNSEGIVKLGDFGLAGMQTAPCGPNGTVYCKSAVGSVNYMSPERIRGEKYSFQSDIWSLGLLLAECAYGNFPLQYAGGNMFDMWSLLQKETFEIQFQEKASQALRDFIHDCVQMNPNKRPSAKKLLGHHFILQNTLQLTPERKLKIRGPSVDTWLRESGYRQKIKNQLDGSAVCQSHLSHYV